MPASSPPVPPNQLSAPESKDRKGTQQSREAGEGANGLGQTKNRIEATLPSRGGNKIGGLREIDGAPWFIWGLPWWLSGKESACQCRRLRFSPWVRKIPWRRKWQPTQVFLPGKSHGQRSLAGYSPRGHKRVGHDLATEQQWRTSYSAPGQEKQRLQACGGTNHCFKLAA